MKCQKCNLNDSESTTGICWKCENQKIRVYNFRQKFPIDSIATEFLAFCRASLKLVTTIAAKMPIIAITTNNSIRVNPFL